MQAMNFGGKNESEQIAKELGLTEVDVDIDIETFVGGYKQIHLFFDGISVTADILSRIEDSAFRQTTIHWETKCIVLESPEDQIPDEQLVTDGGVRVDDQTDLWNYALEPAAPADTCPSGREWCDGPETEPHPCLGCFKLEQ